MNAESYSLNQSFGARNIQTTIHGKRCLSLNNSADYGKRFHTSFYEDNIHLNTSVRKACSTHKNKSTRTNHLFTDNKNSTRFIVNPASPFLEEMYWKYSKSLQRYFSRNKEGMKLYGNKYFENISIDAFLRTRGASQKKMLAKIKNLKETQNPNQNETEFYFNDSGINVKTYKNNKVMFTKVSNVINEELTDDEFFLTPLPNKSRKLLVTKKEKGEFLKAERAAVMMRTFEYTHGIRSRVGFNQYNKMIEEEKQRLMSLMLGAASKIQQWWKRRRNMNNNNAIYEKDSNDTDSDMFTQRYNEYLQVLEKKKKQNLIDKLAKYIHKYNTVRNKKEFIEKFKEYCKSVSKKNLKCINNWNEVIFICDNEGFSICADVVVKERVKSKVNFITKSIYGNRWDNTNTKGNLVSLKDVVMYGKHNGNERMNCNNKKECLGYVEQIEKVIMLQRCVKNYLNYVNYKRIENSVKENSMNDAFGFVNKNNMPQSKELYSNRNTNLKTKSN